MEYKLEFRIKVHECNVLWEGSKSLEIAHCEHIHLHEVECMHHNYLSSNVDKPHFGHRVMKTFATCTVYLPNLSEYRRLYIPFWNSLQS